MLDEDDLQRRGKQKFWNIAPLIVLTPTWLELQRLLSTAKDEERKATIQKAIQALDESQNETNVPGKFSMSAMNPSIQSSLFGGQSVSWPFSVASVNLIMIISSN